MHVSHHFMTSCSFKSQWALFGHWLWTHQVWNGLHVQPFQSWLQLAFCLLSIRHIMSPLATITSLTFTRHATLSHNITTVQYRCLSSWRLQAAWWMNKWKQVNLHQETVSTEMNLDSLLQCHTKTNTATKYFMDFIFRIFLCTLVYRACENF